jgi:AraC-like DNA-binding protein
MSQSSAVPPDVAGPAKETSETLAGILFGLTALVALRTASLYAHAGMARMTALPDDMTVRPNLRRMAPVDPLSEVLRSIRLKGAVFLSAHFTAPWCVSVSINSEDCARFIGKPAQVIGFHVVIEGALLVALDGKPTIDVQAGEIVLFPQNDDHVLANEAGIRPVTARDLIQPAADGELLRIVYGGGGTATRIVCGFLASEDTYNPLMSTLPRVLKIDVREGASREWIEASVRFAAGELAEGRLASSSVMSRLAESLLTEAVRHYSSALAEEQAGWLKGLKDPHVGRALALMHHDPAAPWSAEVLAGKVALSRSAFMERFTSLVGMPPIRYLTVWRLQTAKIGLQETGKTIAQLAHAAGYESEEAFSRAFKREFGVSPARWRDRHLTA